VYHDGTPVTGAVDLALHWTHGCAHANRGELVCWGRGLDGEFGDGTFLNRGTAAPLEVSCP
jgi:hypothetical protein